MPPLVRCHALPGLLSKNFFASGTKSASRWNTITSHRPNITSISRPQTTHTTYPWAPRHCVLTSICSSRPPRCLTPVELIQQSLSPLKDPTQPAGHVHRLAVSRGPAPVLTSTSPCSISHRSPVPAIGAIPHGLGVLATPPVSTTSPSFKSVHVQWPQIVPPPLTLSLHHPRRMLLPFPPPRPFQRPLSHHYLRKVSQFRSVIASLL
jgi:hypothetical protein